MSSPIPSPPPLPLPKVEGPKLEPYGGTATADIDFIHYIGTGDDADSEVWKVSIDGQFYALKIFFFQNWKKMRYSYGEWAIPYNSTFEDPAEFTPQEYVDWLEPFSCECRAYGRLNQEGREDITPRAYGYVLLTPDQERRVSEEHDEDYEDGVRDLDGRNQWSRSECHRNEPLRAIVKEFVDKKETPDFVSAQVPQMYDDLETLHSLGILVRDINIFNYLGGRLIDFSRSWTMPQPCLENPADQTICEERQEELRQFCNMLCAWSHRYDPDLQVPERLKPYADDLLGDNHLGFDPRDCDWGKWEDDEDGDQVERNAGTGWV